VRTERQLQNLKRGGAPATAAAAARARAAKAQQRESTDRLGEIATDDPWAAYNELHATMTKHITKLLKDEQRSGGKPNRETTDRLREYRQTTEALATYRKNRGSAVEDAREFFATMQERMENAYGSLEAIKGLYPVTDTEPPCW
jgi:hypothetical protein